MGGRTRRSQAGTEAFSLLASSLGTGGRGALGSGEIINRLTTIMSRAVRCVHVCNTDTGYTVTPCVLQGKQSLSNGIQGPQRRKRMPGIEDLTKNPRMGDFIGPRMPY